MFKAKPMRVGRSKILQSVFCMAFSFSILSCTSQVDSDLKSARKATQAGDFHVALALYESLIKKNLSDEISVEAAREAARVAYFETKNYQKAVGFYRMLILKSTNLDERVEAQRKIVDIYFEHFQDYSKSIAEINSVLQLPTIDKLERQKQRLNLAKAYYYQNDYRQSLSEITQLLKSNPPVEIRFSAELLNANILIGQKNYAAASQLLIEVIDELPTKAQEENLPLLLAVTLEENGQYDKAIKVLKDYRDHYKTPEYIDLRINHVLERQKNAPGAKGFRK